MSLTIIDSHGLMSHDLRRFAERRVRFALSRFADQILAIELRVAPDTMPNAGGQTACHVAITLRRAGDVVITDRDNDTATCVSRVAQRAGRAVMRVVERTQSLNDGFAAEP